MQLLNPKNDKNKIRSFCLSISRRNTDIPEVIDEYSEILNLTKADTICHIIREYPTLKNKERFREMQSEIAKLTTSKDKSRIFRIDLPF